MAPPRRILLAATGLSPQIVTETLYALATEPVDQGRPRFIPTEVHLITTQSGARLARTALLHADGGQFHALLADYPQLGQPRFDADHIHVIADAHGHGLDDIRSPADNAAAADTITALMAELTRDNDSALHVSIAGGRKTMGFYLGYAFSLFARVQDELSHVLVSSPFESHPDFFFPPAQPRRLATPAGQHLDTADAHVTLARIPVVHLRHGQPRRLLAGRATYSDTVAALEQSMQPPRLLIDLTRRQVRCGNQPVRLPPMLLAWLAWWARQALEGRPQQSWRNADPRGFLHIYRRVIGPMTDAFERTEARLHDGLADAQPYMEKEFFEQNNAKLQRALKDQLGLAAHPYLLGTTGKRPHTRRGLALPSAAIDLTGD